jgi:hypothetical protein
MLSWNEDAQFHCSPPWEYEITEEEATQKGDLEGLEHLPPFCIVVESIGLASEEQREALASPAVTSFSNH